MGSTNRAPDPARDDVSAAFDEVNKLLAEAERAAAAVTVGPVYVDLPVVAVHEDGEDELRRLALHKRPGGRWQLMLGQFDYQLASLGDRPGWVFKPLLECSLEERLDASRHVPSLLSAVADERRKRAASARLAALGLASSIAAFKAENGAQS